MAPLLTSQTCPQVSVKRTPHALRHRGEAPLAFFAPRFGRPLRSPNHCSRASRDVATTSGAATTAKQWLWDPGNVQQVGCLHLRCERRRLTAAVSFSTLVLVVENHPVLVQLVRVAKNCN